jgi:hypothetical protein
MNYSMPRLTLVETLLNTLEAERYVRGPLLRTIVDELSCDAGLEMAAEAARAIVDCLDSGQLGESELGSRIAALRGLVQALSAPPESGVRAKEVPEALARAAPRHGATASAA